MTEEERKRLQEQQAAVAPIPAQEQAAKRPYEANFLSVVNAQRGGSWPTPAPTTPAPIRPETNMRELQKKRTDELLAQEQAAKRAEATAPATTTLDDVYSQLMKARIEAQQKESAELRRHGRTQQMIGGITDAANALASMYNATRGAAPTYDPRASLEGKALARYDRAKAEMDKSHAQQMAYMQQLLNGELKSQQQKNAARRLGLQETDQLRKISNADFARYKFDLQNALNNRKLDAQIARDEALALYRQGMINLGQYREVVRMTDMENKASGAYDKDYTEVTTKDIVDGKEVTTKERKNNKGGGKKANPMGGTAQSTNGKKQNPMGNGR